MTVHEKMKEVFGIAFKPWSNDEYTSNMIDCLDISCRECPLNNNCCGDGVVAWLESEYVPKDGRQENPSNSKTEYEIGFEDGKAQVISDLSKIFLRR